MQEFEFLKRSSPDSEDTTFANCYSGIFWSIFDHCLRRHNEPKIRECGKGQVNSEKKMLIQESSFQNEVNLDLLKKDTTDI